MRDNHITSVERALKILEVFGESPQSLTLTEVTNLSGLAKSTTQRFLNTLHALGYLNREHDKRYALSTRIISLAFHFLNTSNLSSVAKPFLDELSIEMGMSTNMAVRDGLDIIILYRREVRKFFNFNIHPGSKMPAHASALGRVLLAGMDRSELVRRLDEIEIEKVTSKTVTSKEEIIQKIETICENGYAISEQELSMDHVSLAVPLINDQEKIVAGINVSLDVMKKDGVVEKTALTRLIDTGKSISRLLGYTGSYPRKPTD